jgi:hypothetical protein
MISVVKLFFKKFGAFSICKGISNPPEHKTSARIRSTGPRIVSRKFRARLRGAIRRKQHAMNRLLQMRSLVIGWRDDGNFHEQMKKANLYLDEVVNQPLGGCL